MTDHGWGQSPPFSVGVEEELMILDPETLAQTPAVTTLLRAAEGQQLPGRLKTELFASVVELNTGVCGDAHEAAAALTELRRSAAALAAEHGLLLAAAGSHPFSDPQDQEIAPEKRYRGFVDYAGTTARRQGVNGLHVHVGMPSADVCLQALEGVLPWLPVLLALSANSPYLVGRETGLLSARAEVLGLLPRHGAPPPFGTWTEWERLVARFAAAGIAPNYTTIWWDVRPHPSFGTLEIRIVDQPTSLSLTVAFVALVQALCAAVLRDAPRAIDPIVRGVYDQNRWAASAHGPRARLIDVREERGASALELYDELRALVAPVALDLATERLLTPLDPTRCEADRQLEVGRRDGVAAVAADLVDRSVPER